MRVQITETRIIKTLDAVPYNPQKLYQCIQSRIIYRNRQRPFKRSCLVIRVRDRLPDTGHDKQITKLYYSNNKQNYR